MKKMLVVLLTLFFAFGASAQKRVVVRPPAMYKAPRVVYYPRPYFYNPYYLGMGFNYGYMPGYYRQQRPSKLDRQIEDIKQEYGDRISSVKADDELDRKDRREKLRSLRRERDEAVTHAKKNYYKQYEN